VAEANTQAYYDKNNHRCKENYSSDPWPYADNAKRLSKDKHSSLFVFNDSDEGKKFLYN
jgi:hypothetical protein